MNSVRTDKNDLPKKSGTLQGIIDRVITSRQYKLRSMMSETSFIAISEVNFHVRHSLSEISFHVRDPFLSSVYIERGTRLFYVKQNLIS